MIVYKTYLKIVKKNSGLILMYLAIFFGITMIFQAVASGDENPNYQAESVRIQVVDDDGGELAEGLKDYLGGIHEVSVVENDTAKLQEDLFYRNTEYIVRIPSHFFENCIRDEKPLKVTKIPGAYTAFYVDQQINSFLNNARCYSEAGFTEAETAEAIADIRQPEVEMLDDTGNAGKMPAYAYYFRYLPYLLLSVFCYVMGNVFSAFRKEDMRKRLNASAVPVFRQNAEGFLAVLTLGLGLWGVVILAGMIMYRSSLLESEAMPWYLMNSVMLLLVTLSLSYLVGIFVKNTEMLSGIVNTLSLGTCFLCGVFVPLEIMNKSVTKVAQFLPVYWYEKANDLLVDFGAAGGEVRDTIIQAIGIQFAFAAAILLAGMAASKVKREG